MRNKLYMVAIVVAFVFVVGWSQYAHGQRTSSRQVWEYHLDPIRDSGNCDPQMLAVECSRIWNERLLNQRGAEGWELTAIGANNFYFRRAK